MWQHTSQSAGRARSSARVPVAQVDGAQALYARTIGVLAICVLGLWSCRAPKPGPKGPTDPQLREDPQLGLPVHAGSVLEGLPEPKRGLDGKGRR